MTVDVIDDRPTKPAMFRGFRRKCPNCGEGNMFSGYLKVADNCDECGEALYHHRADDGPAYLTILIVGHLLAPLIHVVWTNFRPDPLVMITIFTIFCVGLSLFLLPPPQGVCCWHSVVPPHARLWVDGSAYDR